MKLYVSKAKSIHKENEEKGIWNQKDHIKNPDGAAEKKEKKKNGCLIFMINGLIKVSVQNSIFSLFSVPLSFIETKYKVNRTENEKDF